MRFSSGFRGPDSPRQVSLGLALLGGIGAAAATGAGMAFLRSTLQVRTVPERLMEWVLIFVPIDVFEAGILRFGFDAKRYALYGAVAATLVVLAALGTLALKRGWSNGSIATLGLGLWVFTMVIIMPLTGGGFFALDITDATQAVVTGYLAGALTYTAVLLLARSVLLDRRGLGPAREGGAPRLASAMRFPLAPFSRRYVIGAVGAAMGMYVGAFVLDRWGPRRMFTAIRVLDPQDPVPSGGIGQPNPHPNLLGTPEQQTQAARTGSSGSSTEPPPPREMVRDKDGALLPSGRRPGDLAELITANDDFYIVTKNPVRDPVLNTDNWRLIIDGEVERPIQLDYRSLRNMPAVEVTKTLECISNFVTLCEMVPFGCDLMGTARWKGVRLSQLIDLAGGVKRGAVAVAAISSDEYTTALPLEAVMDPQSLLVYEMNGQVLPREHGYPARMLVPGRYGMKNAKWVAVLRVLNREFIDWYGQRMWSKDGIVKTMTRIDVPAPRAVLMPGQHRIAGVAYGADRGISKVEFSPDGGRTWHAAQYIEPSVGRDAWIRWQGQFEVATAGDVTLMARATDGYGEPQIEAFSLPQPDGGSGWHTCEVRVQSA
jgi:DMSO/TMAO reductase YedYZ molybdopterin-dependent catalytic subunit